MLILLVIGSMIPIVYLGHLMSKLDTFISVRGFDAEVSSDTEVNIVCPGAVVMGETKIAKQLAELLRNKGIPVFLLKEPFMLEQGQNLYYLFALSENDTDNIVSCKIGKKVYNMENIISLCNDHRNEGMFINENISFLSGGDVTADVLFRNIWGKGDEKL